MSPTAFKFLLLRDRLVAGEEDAIHPLFFDGNRIFNIRSAAIFEQHLRLAKRAALNASQTFVAYLPAEENNIKWG